MDENDGVPEVPCIPFGHSVGKGKAVFPAVEE